jgi:hypothetical protein
MSTKRSECVRTLASAIHHANRISSAPPYTAICDRPVPLYHIVPHYLTNGTILGEKLVNTKSTF